MAARDRKCHSIGRKGGLIIYMDFSSHEGKEGVLGGKGKDTTQ